MPLQQCSRAISLNNSDKRSSPLGKEGLLVWAEVFCEPVAGKSGLSESKALASSTWFSCRCTAQLFFSERIGQGCNWLTASSCAPSESLWHLHQGHISLNSPSHEWAWGRTRVRPHLPRIGLLDGARAWSLPLGLRRPSQSRAAVLAVLPQSSCRPAPTLLVADGIVVWGSPTYFCSLLLYPLQVI